MLHPIDIRIKAAIDLLRKSYDYIKQAIKNIRDYRRNSNNTISLENALNNNRKALEGFYNSLMELYGIEEDDIFVFLEIQNYEEKLLKGDTSIFKLDYLSKPENNSEPTLKNKEDFFIKFAGLPTKEAAISKRARNEGNTGSHFVKNIEITSSNAELICYATAGLICGQLIYLTNSALDKKEIERETSRIFNMLTSKLTRMQIVSFHQCEINSEKLKNNNSNKQSKDNLRKSLKDNLILAISRKKYADILFLIGSSSNQDRLSTCSDIYEHLAFQNKETTFGKELVTTICDLKSSTNKSKNNRGNISSVISPDRNKMHFIIAIVIIIILYFVFLSFVLKI